MKLRPRIKWLLRTLLEIRKNVVHFLPLYHQYNAYVFNRRYKNGGAPWCEISDGLCKWLLNLRGEAVALAPEGRILEIGCGNGSLTSQLFKDSMEVIGLDISMEAIKLAKKHERENLTFRVHNLERDPLMGENSLIICEDVLYYVPFVSMKKVARKLSDALVKGGVLLVIDYLPEDMETRYYYQMLSRYFTRIRIEPITYSPENARFMIAIYRRG